MLPSDHQGRFRAVKPARIGMPSARHQFIMTLSGIRFIDASAVYGRPYRLYARQQTPAYFFGGMAEPMDCILS